LLEDLLNGGTASRELIWRLSKWCDWNDPSERIARSIAAQLFHGNVCRRLRDQNDRPIPNRDIAEADYQLWLERVAQISQGLQPDFVFPDEVDSTGTYAEGAVRQVLINSYERDPEARRKCIEFYGAKCFICRFDFGETYDGVGQGFIHVHHLRKLSDLGAEHAVDPITDLRPVCPNCHAIIHLNREPFTIEDVKSMVARAGQKVQH
jgi:hypothetical protein